MSVWLYLSPHLDDVVLSLGGTLAARAAAGERQVVATVFSSPGGDAPERAEALYARRRAEDQQALARVGAACVHLDLPDAPFRDSALCSYRSIVFDSAPGEEDASWMGRLCEALGPLLAEVQPDRVVAPLGVGGHIDHRLVHRAATHSVPLRHLEFYEDRPYAFLAAAVAVRWWQLGARPLAPLRAGSGRVRPPDLDEELAFVQRYCVDEADRGFVLARLEEEREALPDEALGVGRWQLAPLPWTRTAPTARVVRRRLAPRHAGALVDAISCYRSQLSDLFGLPSTTPEGGLQSAIGGTWRARLGGVVEPGWWESRWLIE